MRKDYAVLLILLIIPLWSYSQKSELNLFYSGIFNSNLSKYDLQGDPIESSGFGYMTGINYTFQPKNTYLKFGILAGYKYLTTSGTVGEFDFSSQTSKVLAGLQITYLLTDKLELGIVGLAENNKDFDNFNRYAIDLFRYNVGLISAYSIVDWLSVTFSATTCVYPRQNIYVISNPSEQISLGISIDIFSL